ncbi:hypothetical protein D3C72_1993330 [compost metagenome]
MASSVQPPSQSSIRSLGYDGGGELADLWERNGHFLDCTPRNSWPCLWERVVVARPCRSNEKVQKQRKCAGVAKMCRLRRSSRWRWSNPARGGGACRVSAAGCLCREG